MKVLHVVSDLGQGGAQSYVCDLIRQQLDKTDMQVNLLAMFFRGELWGRLENMRLDMECADMRGALDIAGLRRIFTCIRAGQYDVIHVHHYHPAVSAFLPWTGAAGIYTEHGGGLLGGGWKEKLVYRYFHRNYCRFLAISGEMKRVMARVNPVVEDRISVIHNGVDLERISMARPVSGSEVPPLFYDCPVRVGVIGRLEPQKGIDNFLDAAIHVARARDDVVFPVVGDGSLMASLKRKAEEAGIGSRVLFLGYRTDALDILKSFDVFLFTSEYEPFGLVITEAMAIGVPVIAVHKKGAVPEIIRNGVNGVVVTGGSAETLADEVVAMLKDAGRRQKIISEARKTVESKFTMERNAGSVFDVYRQCVPGNER